MVRKEDSLHGAKRLLLSPGTGETMTDSAGQDVYLIVLIAALNSFDKASTEEYLASIMGVAKISLNLPWEKLKESFDRIKADPEVREYLIEKGIVKP